MGSEGTVPPQALDNAPTNFQRGATDVFIWEEGDVGPLDSIRLWHDGSGSSPAWHVDLVQITASQVGKPS